MLQGPQRFAAAVDELASAPGGQHFRSIEGVIVEGIGNGPGQLPEAEIELSQRAALAPPRQPAA